MSLDSYITHLPHYQEASGLVELSSEVSDNMTTE